MNLPPIFEITDRLELPEWLKKHGMTGAGAEVGILFGEFSAHILANWPGRLFMVDPWENQPPSVYLDGCNSVNMNEAMERAVRAITPFRNRTSVLRMYSERAAKTIPDRSLDWVYLDANHAKEFVGQDLSIWMPKVKSGGVIAGHDFYNRDDAWQKCGVKDVIMDTGRKLEIPVNLTKCTSWFFLNP